MWTGEVKSIQLSVGTLTKRTDHPDMHLESGQANRWIKSREKARISENPTMCALDHQVALMLGQPSNATLNKKILDIPRTPLNPKPQTLKALNPKPSKP